MNIYFNDGVNPAVCVHTCSSIIEAWRWVNAQISGYKIVDPYASCSEDVRKSSKTALYEVFEGEPITISEGGEQTLIEPIFSSPHFYTVWTIQPYRITVKRSLWKKKTRRSQGPHGVPGAHRLGERTQLRYDYLIWLLQLSARLRIRVYT